MTLEELEGDLEAFRRELATRTRAFSVLAKGLGPLSRPGGLSPAGALRHAGKLLEPVEGFPADLDEARRRLAEQVTCARDERARSLKRDFLERFIPLFREAGVPPVLRAENPPEYRVPPFSVVLFIGEETAQFSYARLPLGRAVRLDAEEILAAWREAKQRLETSSCEPERLSPALACAYRALLARKGRPPGDRVELSDLYPELAFALQPQRFLEEVDKRNLVGYPRIQFVFDLLRLRREQKLLIGDQRADLGVAHAGAATSRRRAFWLEDESGQGMFYTSFRLVPAREAGEPEGRAESKDRSPWVNMRPGSAGPGPGEPGSME